MVKNTVSPTMLAAFSLFAGFTADELAAAAAVLAPPTVFEKGAVVYGDNAFRHAVGLIVSGSVTVHAPAGEHGALLMNRLGAGQLFGAAAVFGAEDVYVSHITAEEKTSVLFLTQDTLSAWLREFPTLAENYIRFLSGRIRFLNRKLAVLTTGSAEARLYHYLLDHADADGVVALPHSMVELAHTLHIGRSSLYRSLDALQAEGVLEREGRRYRLVK